MWRPLKALERRGVAVTAVPCTADGTLDPADVAAAIRPATRLIAMLHAFNVLGTILPLAEIGALAYLSPLTYAQDLMNHAVLGTGWLDLALLPILLVVLLLLAVRMNHRSRELGY